MSNKEALAQIQELKEYRLGTMINLFHQSTDLANRQARNIQELVDALTRLERLVEQLDRPKAKKTQRRSR